MLMAVCALELGVLQGLLPDVGGGWALAPLQGDAVRCPWHAPPPLGQLPLHYFHVNIISLNSAAAIVRQFLSTMSATSTMTTSSILSVHFTRRASRAPEVPKV